MKQQIVINVYVRSDKLRSKAMEIAAESYGVISVELQGENKDRVVVIGDGVDSVDLAIRLGKKLGRARIETVSKVKENPDPITNDAPSFFNEVPSEAVYDPYEDFFNFIRSVLV